MLGKDLPGRTVALLGALLTTVLAAPAAAAPGDLDRTFGGDGRVALAGAGAFVARAVEIDRRGRIVIGGYLCEPDPRVRDGTCLTGGDASFRLARLTPDGGLDSEFGANGFVTTPIGEGRSEALDLVVYGDGSIVAGGVARSGGRDVFALARYGADGALDPGFGDGGVVLAPVGRASSAIGDLARGRGGTLLAAGQAVDDAGAARMALARFDPAGRLLTAALGGPGGFGYGLAVVPSPGGSAVVAGLAGDSADPAGYRFAAMQVDSDGAAVGALDYSVGSSSSFANAAVPAPGGWLAAGAATAAGGRQAMAAVRGHKKGRLMRRFGGDGKVLVALRDGAVANDVVLDRAGRALLVGQAAVGGGYRFTTVRLGRDGRRDPDFGRRGARVLRWPGYPIARAMAGALEAPGKLVTAGIGCVGGTGAQCTGGTARLLVARQTVAADRTAPAIRARLPSGRVARGRIRGLRVRVGLSERARLRARLSGRLRRSGRRVVLWRTRAGRPRTSFSVRLRPRRDRLTRMRSRLRLDLRAADLAGNAAVRRLTISLRG